MNKIMGLLFVASVLCVSPAAFACRYYRPVAHTMRVNTHVLNPVAKHPVMPRRVASAKRIKSF